PHARPDAEPGQVGDGQRGGDEVVQLGPGHAGREVLELTVHRRRGIVAHPEHRDQPTVSVGGQGPATDRVARVVRVDDAGEVLGAGDPAVLPADVDEVRPYDVLRDLGVAELGQPGRSAVAAAGRVDDEPGGQRGRPVRTGDADPGDPAEVLGQAERLGVGEDGDVGQRADPAAHVRLQRRAADQQYGQSGRGAA